MTRRAICVWPLEQVGPDADPQCAAAVRALYAQWTHSLVRPHRRNVHVLQDDK
jgi:hypothetical protein